MGATTARVRGLDVVLSAQPAKCLGGDPQGPAGVGIAPVHAGNALYLVEWCLSHGFLSPGYFSLTLLRDPRVRLSSARFTGSGLICPSPPVSGCWILSALSISLAPPRSGRRCSRRDFWGKRKRPPVPSSTIGKRGQAGVLGDRVRSPDWLTSLPGTAALFFCAGQSLIMLSVALNVVKDYLDALPRLARLPIIPIYTLSYLTRPISW